MMWPDIPFTKCDWTLERNIKTFESSFTGSQQQADYGSMFWQAQVELKWLTRRQAGQVMGLLAEYGHKGILLPDPVHKTPAGIGGGTAIVADDKQQGKRLQITGAPVDLPGWLLAGDVIQVDNYFYLLTGDVSTDAAGRAELAIVPSLRTFPAAGTAIKTQDVQCIMKLDANQQITRQISTRSRYLASLKLSFVEAF